MYSSSLRARNLGPAPACSVWRRPARSQPVAVDNSPAMSTPALNFVAACGNLNANPPVNGTKGTYLKALKESGAAIGPSQTCPTLRSTSPLSPGCATPSPTPSTPLRGQPRSALPSSPSFAPYIPFRETDLHRLANMPTWSPCSSRPNYPPFPRPLRSPCRATLVAASTLHDRRPRSKPRRLLLRRHPPLPRLPRPSSTSQSLAPARSAS